MNNSDENVRMTEEQSLMPQGPMSRAELLKWADTEIAELDRLHQKKMAMIAKMQANCQQQQAQMALLFDRVEGALTTLCAIGEQA